MPEIEFENGKVKSIDGNAMPTTKLYGHYIIFSNTDTDKYWTFLIDDNPESYKKVGLRSKYVNLTIPCYGFKINGGKVYQYTEFNITPSYYSVRYAIANLERNRIDIDSNILYGSVVASDTVTPLN